MTNYVFNHRNLIKTLKENSRIFIVLFLLVFSVATLTSGAYQNTSAACEQMNFKQTPAVGVGPNPQSSAVEDFDNDGKPDIATVNSNASFSILRNISTAGVISFAPKIDFNTTTSALGLATGDFDGDGKKDIVTANYYNSTISVLRNISNGAGTINFTSNIDFSAGASPRSVAVADFDGDGKLDVVVANTDSHNISILRNTSAGTGVISFDPAINVSVGLQPRSVVTADFNGDGKADIATANYRADAVSVLRNTGMSGGTISFAGKVDFTIGSIPGSDPNSLVAADFDGDGKFDIATADSWTFNITVLRNITGSGSNTVNFAPKINFRVGYGPYSIIAKDFDNDGKLDVATSSFAGGDVSVLRNISNIGSINFESRKEFVVGRAPTAISGSDFDGDGKIDLTIPNSKFDNVSVLRNTSLGIGTIGFDAQFENAITGYAPHSIAIGDFDNDGRKDLVTANLGSDNITILINESIISGTNKFNTNINFASEENSRPFWVAVEDFDGDGKPDIVITNSNLSSISVYRNTSTDQGIINFAQPLSFSVGREPHVVAVGDFDRDGKFDIAAVNHESNNVSILRNISSTTGEINFSPKIDLSVNSNPSGLTINDFNADGKADIAVTNKIGTTVSVFKNLTANKGSISFSAKTDFSVNSQPLFITSEDFDGDGKQDLAVTNFLEPNGIISILRNLSSIGGEIEFAAKLDFPITSNPEFNMIPGHIITAKIDNDTKADIVVVNSVLAVISLLRNSSSGSGTISFEPRIDIFKSGFASSLTAGDFNRDGKQDIAYSTFNSNNVGILESPCSVNRKNQFDYDGDGKSDISVFRPDNGTWYLQQSTSGFAGVQFGIGTDKLVPADYDGDGKTDLAVYRDGNWYLQQSTGGFTGVQFGQNGDITVPADYDGDGKDDIAVYRPSTGGWYRLNSSNGGFVAVAFGTSEDKPTIGDFDGDGKADIAVFRPSTANWFRLNSSNNQFVAVQFGAAEDKLTPADFDGDGKTDITVYRSSTGGWYRLNSTNGEFVAVGFGTAEDIPAAADYDGDGKADIAVFRPSDGTWYLLRSTAGFTAVQFGQANDKPVPSAFMQ